MTGMGTHATTGRRRWLRAVVGAFVVADLCVGGALVAHNVATTSDGPGVTTDDVRAHSRPAPGTLRQRTRAAAIRRLLAARADAIVHHNRAAFLRTVDRRPTPFRSRQAAYFDNLAHVRFASWSYTLDGRHVEPTVGKRFRHYGAPTWGPHVIVHYTLSGFDTTETSLDLYPTFVRRAGGWVMASDTDFARRGVVTIRDLWDYGPVDVVRRGRALVLGHPDGPVSLADVAVEASADIPRVTSVWGRQWQRSVVVLVPNTEHELTGMLCDAGDLHQIAAVASVEVSCSGRYSGPLNNRVMVNPLTFTRLSALGRRVVMTHEITHVATRAATGPLEPTWLVEGIADYIGYRNSGVATSLAARELATQVANGTFHGRLPNDKAYDGSNRNLAAVYERSWLACKFIATHWGERRLVTVYRDVGRTTSGTRRSAVDGALRGVLHVSLTRFLAEWRDYVRAELR